MSSEISSPKQRGNKTGIKKKIKLSQSLNIRKSMIDGIDSSAEESLDGQYQAISKENFDPKFLVVLLSVLSDDVYGVKRIVKYGIECFRAVHFIEWMVGVFGCSREEAILTGEKMCSLGVLSRANAKKKAVLFGDGKQCYFVDMDERKCCELNLRFLWVGMCRKPWIVASDLLSQIIVIYDTFLFGEITEKSLEEAKASEQYNIFERSVGELQHVNLEDASNEQKLSFFLNLYQVMLLHGILDIGKIHPIENMAMEIEYSIEYKTFSLSEVEFKILRTNLTKKNSLKFRKREPPFHFLIPNSSVLLPFGIPYCTDDSPPFRIYKEISINEDLKEMARNFLEDHLVHEDNIIKLPKILSAYEDDYALAAGKRQLNKKSILIRKYFPEKILKSIGETNVIIKYTKGVKKFNFTNYGDFISTVQKNTEIIERKKKSFSERELLKNFRHTEFEQIFKNETLIQNYISLTEYLLENIDSIVLDKILQEDNNISQILMLQYDMIRLNQIDISEYPIDQLFRYLFFFFETIEGSILTARNRNNLVELLMDYHQDVEHTVEFFLSDQIASNYFLQFLKISVSAENFFCWKLIQELQHVNPNSAEQMMEISGEIVNRFLSDNSSEAVNIPAHLKAKSLDAPLGPTMYNMLQKDLTKTMKIDSYQDFLKSEQYENFKKENIGYNPRESNLRETIKRYRVTLSDERNLVFMKFLGIVLEIRNKQDLSDDFLMKISQKLLQLEPDNLEIIERSPIITTTLLDIVSI